MAESQIFSNPSSTEPVLAPPWTPPRQLALIAAEDMPTYRITSPRRRLERSKRRPGRPPTTQRSRPPRASAWASGLPQSQSGGPRAATCPPAPGRTGVSAVLQPVCGRQGTQPAARRGVREASGGAGDSQVEEALVGVSQEKGLYISYTRTSTQ
jgi:hypothetical protein